MSEGSQSLESPPQGSNVTEERPGSTEESTGNIDNLELGSGPNAQRIQQLEAIFQKLADQEQEYADRGEPKKSPLQIIAKAGLQLIHAQTPEEKTEAMEPVKNLFGSLTPDEAEAIIYKKQNLFVQYGIDLRNYLPLTQNPNTKDKE